MMSEVATAQQDGVIQEKDAYGVAVKSEGADGADSSDSLSVQSKPPPPWYWKVIAVVLVCLIHFASSWSSGITSPLKSTLKKQLDINNTEYALLTASDSFIKSVLILVIGLATDRLGGAGTLLYGNILYSIGAILLAAAAWVRSWHFMIGANVIMAFGDVATQVAQYQVFSAWFAPNQGFGATLGLELLVDKLGSLAGSGSANMIANHTGNFAWVYWVSFFICVFTNVCCGAFYFLQRKMTEAYGDVKDPATGEKLVKHAKKFHPGKVLELPWTFWIVLLYGFFTTSTIVIFNSNATEFAEERFNISNVTAGWYATLLKDAAFVLIPFLGIGIDLFGNRITLMCVTGFGLFIAMLLVNYAATVTGTAAAFVIYAMTTVFSSMVIIDTIRSTVMEQTTFGTAYSIKVMVANSIDIIMAIGAGVIQDRDGGSYDHVVILYLAFAAMSLVTCFLLIGFAWYSVDLGRLQWTRKQRMARSVTLKERAERFYGEKFARNKMISTFCFAFTIVLLLGAWACFIWGAATGNNYDD
ncbi:major facilitator superfamily transporter [Xylariales sp. PMI_506]|nr:major facilitator superfamily transporter [Xylariales sp. PMI_506]